MSGPENLAGDDATLNVALDRLAHSAATLTTSPVRSDTSELLTLFTLLGRHLGFEVRDPGRGALDRSSDPIRTIAHASRLRYRAIVLEAGWTRRDVTTTSFMSTMTDPSTGITRDVVVLARLGSLAYQGAGDPAPLPLTPALEDRFHRGGLEFFPPVDPDGPARLRRLFAIGFRGTASRWWVACAMALGVALLGLLTPILTNTIIGTLIPVGDVTIVVQLAIGLVIAAFGILAFGLIQNFAVSAISQVSTRTMQASLWNRLVSLPPTFYRDYSAGDLVVRSIAIDNLQSLLSAQVISAVLGAVFGLVNVGLMFRYDAALALVGVVILSATLAVLALIALRMQRQAELALDGSRHANSWLIQVLNAIVKVRLAHAESRMVALYLDRLQLNMVAQARSTVLLGRINAWFLLVGGLASASFYAVVLIRWTSNGSPISSAEFIAFTAAYALAFGTLSGLVALIGPLVQLGPTLKLLRPILEAVPETSGGQQDPGELTGAVRLSGVSFTYPGTGVPVIQNLNLDIPAGAMVAITGPSGCGKSTLTRLILGFDTPDSGQVLYDGRDLADLDIALVRQQLGVVIQNGRITKGTIAMNIGGDPGAPLDRLWQAAEEAVIADDIRRIPLGMNTIVDPESISGGQAQRILLARALYRQPRIMILDEATSALDNDSQERVTEAMQSRSMTRIVIAHRLTTIRQADLVVVVEAGQVVQQGTFDELMSSPGMFSDLVRRQLEQ